MCDTSLGASSMSSSTCNDVPVAVVEHCRNVVRVEKPVQETLNSPVVDVVCCERSEDSSMITTNTASAVLNPKHATPSESNTDQEESVQHGHATKNIAVGEFHGYKRRKMHSNDDKHEEGHDADGGVGSSYDAVENESSDDESSVNSVVEDVEALEEESLGPTPVGAPLIDSDWMLPSRKAIGAKDIMKLSAKETQGMCRVNKMMIGGNKAATQERLKKSILDGNELFLDGNIASSSTANNNKSTNQKKKDEIKWMS